MSKPIATTDASPPNSPIPHWINQTLIRALIIIALLLTLFSGWLANQYIEQRAQGRLNTELEQAKQTLLTQAQNYQQFLHSGRALLSTQPNLSQQDWQHYTTTLLQQHPQSRIDSIGYAPINGTHAPVQLLAPTPQALGTDLFANSIKRAAIEQAQQSGQAILSSALSLTPTTHTTTTEQGFFIVLPVYHSDRPLTSPSQRQQALQGLVFALIASNDLVPSFSSATPIQLQIGLLANNKIVPLSPTTASHSTGRFKQTITIAMLGQQWQLHASSTPAFDAAMQSSLPYVITAIGLIIDCLLFGAVYSLAKRYRQAVLSAENNHTLLAQLQNSEHNLRQNELRLNEAQQIAHIGSWHLDLASGVIQLSNEAASIVDTTRVQLNLSDFCQLLSDEDRQPLQVAWQAAQQSRSLDIEHCMLTLSGQQKWVRQRAEIRRNQQSGQLEAVGTIQDITKHKKTELALLESEQRINRIFDIVPLAIMVVNSRGIITQANSFSKRTFGYPLHDLVGLNVEQLLPEAIRQKHAQLREHYMKNAYSGQMANGRTLVARKSDGREFYVEVSLTPLFDKGEPCQLVSVSDVSERHNAQIALKASEAKFHHAMLHAPIGMAIIGTDDRFKDVNPALCWVLGYNEQELQLRRIQDVCHPYEQNGLIDLLCQLRQGNCDSVVLLSQHLHKNGHPVLIQLNISTLGGTEQNSGYLIAQFQDMTERFKSESEILAVKNRLEAAASAGIVGVWEWDIQNNHLFWDSVMYKLYGISKSTWHESYQAWTSLIHPDDLALVEHGIDIALKGDGKYASEFRIVRPDGSLRYLKAASHTTFGYDGAPIRMIGVSYDLTEQKQVQQELADARNRAEAASRAKSDFLANMSHEIRTPMNAVTGLTQLLLETQLSKQHRDYLEKINDAAFSLLGILNDILDYSKIEAGKLSIEVVEFSPRQVFESIRNLFSFTAENKGIELILDIAPDLPQHLMGDALRLKQVINNLLGNAIKFTEHGMVKLGVQFETVTNEQQKQYALLKLQVEDTGIGIGEEQQQKLFNAFEQADQTTTRKYGGTGLGLVISKHLIEMMGGHIELFSQLGQGSVFTCQLPLQISPSQSSKLQLKNLHSMSVLILGEHPAHMSMLEKYLEKIACQVTKSTEQSAWSTLVSPTHQLIFLEWDQGNPYQSDLLDAVNQQITDNPTAPCKLVILCSLHQHEEVRLQAAKIKNSLILETPLLPIQLYELVSTCQNIAISTEAIGKHRAFGDYQKNLRGIYGAHALLVEDNATNRFIAKEILSKLGLEVDTAENGLQAIEFAKSHQYQLILMDLQMPKMNGFEAAAQIRRLEGYQTVPIVAMTASAMTASREASIEAGMNDFITKPVTVSELSIKLSRWIKPGSQTPQLANNEEIPLLLPGLDLQGALRYTDHNWKLMRLALDGFLRDFAQSDTEIVEMLNQHDFESAYAAVHTIKGLARTIGASALYEACQQFERELKERQSSSLQHFSAQLSDVIRVIQQLAQIEPPPVRSRPICVDHSKLAATLQQILQHINRQQFINPDLMDELNNNLNETSQLSLYHTLKLQVETINYRAAKQTLFDLAALSNISLEP